MKKWLMVLAVLVTFNDGTETEYPYKRAGVWPGVPVLYMFDDYDQKTGYFIGNYEAIKLDIVKSYKKVEAGLEVKCV